jgi:biotin carboxylase
VAGACVRFLVAEPGVFFDVHGVEEALAQPGVLAVHVYRVLGAIQEELRTGADRAGAVLAVGDSAEDALARADRAVDLVRFEMADAEALNT